MSLNVLIIEDEEDLLEDMPQLLKTYGFRATGTHNYDEALRLLREEEFDCVILDLKMPPAPNMSDEKTENGRRTGIVVCEMIRGIGCEVPILCVTSVRDRVVHSSAMQAGVNRILQKPCYPDEIVQKIKMMARR